MPIYDADNAECLVFTFKEGILSPVAHDLRIRVARFSIAVDESLSRVTATFDTASLTVDSAMKDGVENPSALSSADKQKIASQIREEVLHVDRFPEAIFRSRSFSPQADGGYEFVGDLQLHGATRELAGVSRFEAGRQIVELELHQPDFGITPYKAMLGTLKVRGDVRVRLKL